MTALSPPASESSTTLKILRGRFGFETLKPGQRQVIDTLLAGRSALAIFPTGGGKSLCYQLPALILDGLTLVVSPLIALMKDQIDFLQSHGIPAARLDSSVESSEVMQTFRGLREGSLKILYVAPERLANERFLQTLSRLRVSMLAVDEAHCISEWGHNFRPDYLKLAALARRLKVGRILALTATATPPVAKQIATAFEIAPGDVVRTGFYRPNLAIAVTPVESSNRDEVLLERLKRRPAGPTIVYVTLQRTAESVAALLIKAGFDAAAYHAGMEMEDRSRVQQHFMQSDHSVVVATIAFGMGIDKRNIRYVYHYNIPKSLENYAQEIGRAGRDGNNSMCEVLASTQDRIVLENFVYGDRPEPDAVESLLREILSRGEQFDLSTYNVSSEHDIRPLVVETLMTYLQLDGIVESLGAFYTEFKLRWLKPPDEVLRKFDKPRAAFLTAVLQHGQHGRTWITLDVAAAAEALKEPRQRLVAALTYLDEQGDIELQAVGVRQSYRRLKAVADVAALGKTMNDRFALRETRDIERLDTVLKFCGAGGCRTRRLLAYFGEPLEKDCGHCAVCRGTPAVALPGATPQVPKSELAAAVREMRKRAGDVLRSPRQLARFFCGITSPALTRCKLTRDRRFGQFGEVPFRQVLSAVSVH